MPRLDITPDWFNPQIRHEERLQRVVEGKTPWRLHEVIDHVSELVCGIKTEEGLRHVQLFLAALAEVASESRGACRLRD